MNLPITSEPDGIVISLLVQPGASKTEFRGVQADALKLRVAAPPVDGAANDAICHFLAKFFRVPKSCVTILRGETSRRKKVFVKGLPAALLEAFNNLEQSSGN